MRDKSVAKMKVKKDTVNLILTFFSKCNKQKEFIQEMVETKCKIQNIYGKKFLIHNMQSGFLLYVMSCFCFNYLFSFVFFFVLSFACQVRSKKSQNFVEINYIQICIHFSILSFFVFVFVFCFLTYNVSFEGIFVEQHSTSNVRNLV